MTTKRAQVHARLPASCPHSASPAPLSAASSSSPGFGGTARGPTLLPTFVVRRKPRTALVHRSSASRSRTVKRILPLPVSFRTPAHRVFCCGSHCLPCLSRCSRVCVLYWHHPHSASSAFFVHSRYWPVRQCHPLRFDGSALPGALALGPPFDSADCSACHTSSCWLSHCTRLAPPPISSR